MRSAEKANTGYASSWLPLWFAVLFALGISIVALLQPDPIIGDVLAVRESNDGVVHATVRFEVPTGSGTETVIESLVLPPQYEGAEEVPVWPGNESRETQIGPFGYIELTPTLLVLGSVLAAILGKVVQLTVRGYGYVPGTAQPGQTDPDLVAEDRGFYWRT